MLAKELSHQLRDGVTVRFQGEVAGGGVLEGRLAQEGYPAWTLADARRLHVRVRSMIEHAVT